MPTYHIATFGCKTSQYESAAIEQQLAEAGLEKAAAPEEAMYIIVNTCAVTERAETDAKKLIRKLKKKNPRSILVLAGCFPQRDAGHAGAAPGVDYVVGNSEKTKFREIIRRIEERTQPRIECSEDLSRAPFISYPLTAFGDRTRAFVKIQDGCDNRCSYCIVPLVRGPGRSLAPEEIVRQVAALSEAGYREIVLTGIHVGRYGLDNGSSLLALLREVCGIPSLGRLRLSSIELSELTDDLLAFLRGAETIVPHLHIPLQSGSSKILRLMNRAYAPEDFRRTIEKIAREISSVSIGTDVIAGFPGESEDDFRETEAILSDLPLSYIHVFTFSARPGTSAFSMPRQVAASVRMERSRVLRKLARGKSFEFRKRFSGEIRPALILNQHTKAGKRLALTDNYIRVALRNEARQGLILPVRIDAVFETATEATVVQCP
jgi:threonylcarbamoyladenosine tRNA methylthiotransferase MtaB